MGVEVIDPQGRRPLSLKDSTSAQTYQLASAGFYELKLANGRRDVIGVNPDRRESNLDIVPDDTLALVARKFGHGNRASRVPRGSPEEQKQPYRLWWYIMLLVFAAAIAESLLADRYLGAQQQEDL